MGDDQRTITADQAMLATTQEVVGKTPEGTYDTHRALVDIEDPTTRAGLPFEPGYEKGYGTQIWESDPDPRTRHFSQRYSHLLYSLYWADQRLMQERSITYRSLGLMASRYAAAEDESSRAVFDVPLPPKPAG